MPFCAKCGASQSEGAAFCPSCGAKSTNAGPSSVSPEGRASAAFPSASTGITSNVAGALAYLGGFVTGIIFLSIGPYNKDPFIRFHAWQSIFLSVFYIVSFAVLDIVFGAFTSVGLGFLWSLVALLMSLVRLVFLLSWLFMMFKAYNNERFSLPVIGPLAAQKAANS